MTSDPHLLTLLAQMRAAFPCTRPRTSTKRWLRSVMRACRSFPPPCGCQHFGLNLGLHLIVPLLAPGAEPDQVHLSAARPDRRAARWLIRPWGDISRDRRRWSGRRRGKSPIRSASGPDWRARARPPIARPHGPRDNRCRRRAARECRSHARGRRIWRSPRRRCPDWRKSPIGC